VVRESMTSVEKCHDDRSVPPRDHGKKRPDEPCTLMMSVAQTRNFVGKIHPAASAFYLPLTAVSSTGTVGMPQCRRNLTVPS
jgi:hypothetical protein